MKLYGFIALLLIIVAIIAGSFVGGILYDQHSQAVKSVDSLVILNKIEDEASLITKSIYINQKSVITVDQGSDWSNFWWGQTLTAEALMKVDVGVDYKKLSQTDIQVDQSQKVISITLPKSEVLNVAVDGKINVQNQAGLLKAIFSDTNSDYNKALDQLKTDATTAVEQNTDLMTSAKTDSVSIIQLVLKDTGYTVKVS